jgi:hypothetical protein
MPFCECCHGSEPTREFCTSGAMYRGCQFVWSGQVCESCLWKLLHFEMDILASVPRDCPAPVNPIYELWRRGATDRQIRDFIERELNDAATR